MTKIIIIDGKKFDFSRTKDHPDIFLALVRHENGFCLEEEKYIFYLDPITKTFISAKYQHTVDRVGSPILKESVQTPEILASAIAMANEALKGYEDVVAAGEVEHLE